MINISMPYRTGSPEQVPLEYLISNNFKIEANVFDINQLLAEESIHKLTKELFDFQSLSRNIVGSLHFPTDNADYLSDPEKYKALISAINICSETGISIIVLHSNYIISSNLFNKNDIENIRNGYSSLLSDIDLYITKQNIKVLICIENMPIIGNDGIDFDSVFIFPEDFVFIKNLKNMAVTLDICHWGFTCEFMKSIDNIHPYIESKKSIKFNDMLKISNIIKHLHLSSFKYLTFPHTMINCEEGIIPNLGLISEQEILSVLKSMQDDEQNRLLTLEIKEIDYTNRINFIKTVDWLKNIMPSLFSQNI
ncbi:TPA: hypothetical protein DCX66_04005 [Candidatus Nomurabacteria bacterium]|uniref:AP endonuclease, family 2 n=1 Tax=Candidatus Nomurabacteria bacterium GW2011_GWE1_35_16 TaxID=1618761 RepID=A0A0G0DT82_9BACT|nr:MAG: AP endonuclease, family 2 [Candidatus Nomurabacteria bacterium GW2011_GWF1_34_20]KKP62792.1 MAG: AP endonuclease, family 2 [Candidatus Nomurabacteria bacterium GW2011_GWE2_34_25]KKP66190.1 MAG: AP endonuclease, family 2 [Candidatus Nomurabacteria bacterium GW2011_GWE1_35_16]HAE36253.1 hypothetical protein [Candidatus Nomurabacteria bacterium]HAX65602.1 hypothetical protein [Candidatus Nomurabacteria bacterium]